LTRVNAVTAYLRGLNPQLPRPVWLLEAGGVANSLGNGIVLPFLIIYLHEVRDFGLGTAGAIVSTLGAVGLVATPLAGRLIDLIGARTTLMSSLALLAAGYGAFPFIHHSWQGFGLAALAGLGNGGFAPSHSSLLAALTSREQRNAAYALQRATDNLGFGAGALIGGLIATTSVPSSFKLLFLLDAGTFLAFIAVLSFVPRGQVVAPAARLAGRYSTVLRDRAFVFLLLIIATLVTAAYAQVSTVLPPFAKEHAGVSEAGIGVVFFVNTVLIVIAQLPLAKALEGRRRMRALALAAAIFTATSVAILVIGKLLDAGTAVVTLCGVIVLFGIGECLHGAVQNPLIADLAPEHLLGRYMALRTVSWQLGFMVGPVLGSFLLEHSTTGLWLGAAAACGLACAGSLALERQIPAGAARTPGPARIPRKALRVEWRILKMRLDDPLSTGAQPAPHQASEASPAGEGGCPTA
jgi:MFS family permease